MSQSRGDDFEPWLERELQQAVGSVRGPSPRAEQAAYRAAPLRRARLAVKSVAAIAAVGLAVAVGITGVAAMTGSPNPMSIGHRMVEAVTMASQHGSAPPVKAPDAPANGGRSGASPGPSPSGDAQVDPTPDPVQSGALKRDYDRDQNDQGQQAQQAQQSSRPEQPEPASPAANPSPKPRRDKHPVPSPSPTGGA